MLHIITQNGVLYFLTAFFIKELCGVATHEGDTRFTSEFVFKVFNVWKYVKAVNAAVGPEVYQYQFVF